jgi:M-phase inducer tyrosine phosphatase
MCFLQGDCEPNGYVEMDDPAHTHARDIDLDKFRRGKWLRTQSFTYGETLSGTSPLASLPPAAGSSTTTSREHRKTAPSGGPSGSGTMFAAANAARGRRAGAAVKGLSTLDEDPASSSGHEDSESSELHDSPCPPPSKGVSRLSSGRSGLARVLSFGPATASRR